MILTQRFEKAFCLASELHRHQKRKNIPTPYLCHLMAVGALVCENIEGLCDDQGLAEDYVITAVLHDAVEDQGGMPTYELIVSFFGRQVADNVLMLSDSVPDGSARPDKEVRNAVYLNRMKSAPREIVLISCCDKIHNLRTMAADYKILGQQLWSAFSQSAWKTMQNYRLLGEVYADRLGSHRVVSMYREVLASVESLLPKDAGEN